ncbi:hypothetical protein [Erysipelothrix urinaevulpis]
MKNKKLLFFVIIVLLALGGCSEKAQSKEEPKEEPKAPEFYKQTVTLLDKEYVLPVAYKDLEKDGWILVDNDDYELEAGKVIRNRYIRNGAYILDVSFFNPMKDSLPLKETYVATIGAENRTFGSDKASDIKINKGINFATPIETIIEALGDYTKEENAQFITYTFQHDKVSKTEIKLTVENKTIRWIIVESFRI